MPMDKAKTIAAGEFFQNKKNGSISPMFYQIVRHNIFCV